jgi:hypothetical protein
MRRPLFKVYSLRSLGAWAWGSRLSRQATRPGTTSWRSLLLYRATQHRGVTASTQADSSGKVSVARLQKILTEFQLTIDVAKILQDEGKTDLTFEEFKAMLA